MKSKVKNLLENLNIQHRWVEHKAIHTVEDSLEIINSIGCKTPIKNLLLQDTSSKQFFLVIMSGEKRLNMKELAGKLNIKKFQFAKSPQLKELMGVEPGSVSLFGLIYDTNNKVKLVIEKQLLDEEELGFPPNDNTATVFISPNEIQKIIDHLDRSVLPIDL